MEVLMARFHLSTTHLWSEQQTSIDGRTFVHRQCRVCSRDFVRSLEDGEWRAVHVGVLKFDFLDEETSGRWVSEDCHGRVFPGEENNERIQRGGEVRAPKPKH
jgi:hypothetical protein